MRNEGAMLLAGLVLVAAFLATLLAQPLRGLVWRGWRALMLLLAPMVMLGQVAAVGLLADRALQVPAAAVVLAAMLALLCFPLALLAAMLLARPEPPGLRPALAGVGVSPGLFWRRVTLPALLPGFLLGWMVSVLAGLAALAWAAPRLLRL